MPKICSITEHLYSLRLAATIVGAVAVSGCSVAPTVPMASDPTSTPIVGVWKWVKSTNGCEEVRTYYPDGTFEVTSAEEIITGRYLIAQQPDANGRIRFDTVEETDNLEPDCSGNISTNVGRTFTDWLAFSDDRNVLVMYDSVKGQGGYGPVLRIGSFEVEEETSPAAMATAMPVATATIEPADTAPLIFNWQPDAQALVTETIEKPRGLSQLRYRVRTEANPDTQGVVLRFEDYALLPGIIKQRPDEVSSYSHMPSFQVTADGEFAGMVGANQWLQDASDATRGGALTAEQRREAAQSAESVVLLRQRVSDVWSAWVETWVGMDPNLTAPVLGTDSLDIGGASVQRQYRLERVTDSDINSDEVSFRLTVELSGPQFVASIENNVQQLAASMGSAQPHELTQLRTATQRNVYQITTDVHTLKPKQVKTEQTVELSPEDGATQALTEKHTYDFAWQ